MNCKSLDALFTYCIHTSCTETGGGKKNVIEKIEYFIHMHEANDLLLEKLEVHIIEMICFYFALRRRSTEKKKMENRKANEFPLTGNILASAIEKKKLGKKKSTTNVECVWMCNKSDKKS